MKHIFCWLVTLLITLNSMVVFAKDVNFNFLPSTPIGSWQLREQIDTNHKGKQTGTTMRTSMVGKEKRNDEMHYWIEMGIDTFKISKKGKRKPKGKRTVMKSLIPESVLSGDAANVLSNLRTFGVETIIQNGKEKPIRMTNSGGMMAAAMSMTNTEIKYDFESLGTEKVTVPAGEFDSRKIRGSGSVEMKVVFKKIQVDSDTTMWVSDNVPFGTVKIDGTSVTNGKPGTQTAELLEYGKSGAQSEITQEPEDMPEIPNMGDLFGN